MYLRRIAATAIGQVSRVHSAASLPFASGPAAVEQGAAPDTATAEQSVPGRRPETRIDRNAARADPGRHDVPVAASHQQPALSTGKVRPEQPAQDSAVVGGFVAPAPLIEEGVVAQNSSVVAVDDGSFIGAPGYASVRAESAPVPADQQETSGRKVAPSLRRGGSREQESAYPAAAPLDAAPTVPSPQLLLPPSGDTDGGAVSARAKGAAMTEPGRADRHRTEGDSVDVHVTIGRIEIDARRAAPQDADRRQRRERRPVMTLDDYLATRERQPK